MGFSVTKREQTDFSAEVEAALGKDAAPFVPQAEVIPPTVNRFLGVAATQYGLTQTNLIRTAELLEAKAAELRRRADQLNIDYTSMHDTVRNAVKYEEECRNVAQSLSLISLKEGE